MAKVGLRDDDLVTVRGLITKPNGIVMVTGPTGSGKTLSAFLWAIDRVFREKAETPQDAAGTRILYISPLKALGVDGINAKFDMDYHTKHVDTIFRRVFDSNLG